LKDHRDKGYYQEETVVEKTREDVVLTWEKFFGVYLVEDLKEYIGVE